MRYPHAGKLRHPVIIERNTEPRNASGGVDEDWQPFAHVRAAIEPMQSGKEIFNPDWTTATTVYIVTIRFRSDLTTKMRVNFGGRLLYIRQVPFVANVDRFIGLICEEVSA